MNSYTIVSMWSEADGHFIWKFKLYILNQEKLYDADEVAESLLKFDGTSFWDVSNRRELLYLIYQRWNKFSEATRRKLINRLLSGSSTADRISNDGKSHESNPDFRRKLAAQYVFWLTTRGCALTKSQKQKLDKLIRSVPDWDEEEATSIETDFESHDSLTEDHSADKIINLPVDSVIDAAQKIYENDSTGTVIYRPFIGFVQSAPDKVLKALLLRTDFDDFTIDCWKTTINAMPHYASEKVFTEFLECLCQLPEEVVQRLRYRIGQLILQRFDAIYVMNASLAWNLFDYFLECINAGDESLTESEVNPSPYNVNINPIPAFRQVVEGPAGQITMGLLYLIKILKIKNKQGIPHEFKSRIAETLSVKGVGKFQAIMALGLQLNMLYLKDSDWVEKEILPWLDFKHENSTYMWAGFLEGIEKTSATLLAKIKHLLPKLFPFLDSVGMYQDLVDNAARLVIRMAVLSQGEEDRITTKELHKMLKDMNEKSRIHAITFLRKIGSENVNENGWENLVLPLIAKSWPVEKKYRSESAVVEWVRLLGGTGESYPVVFPKIRKFLCRVAVHGLILTNFGTKSKTQNSLTVRFPDLVLELLDDVVSDSPSFYDRQLEQILD